MPFTVLVPQDGSDLAKRALPFAAGLARGAGGRVVLLHAQAASHADRPTLAHLHDAAAGLRASGLDAGVSVYHTWYRDAGSAILDAARDLDADLIVLGAHGAGLAAHRLYGHDAEDVLRRAHVPVFLVGTGTARPWPAARAPRLLVPLDGSPFGDAALLIARRLARLTRGRLILLRIAEPPDAAQTKRTGRPRKVPAIEQIADELEWLADRIRASGVPVVPQLKMGEGASAIVATASEQRADAIVMATHGAHTLVSEVLGETAASILAQVAVPVIFVKPIEVRQPLPAPVMLAPAGRPESLAALAGVRALAVAGAASCR